jgi:REP element-mobilizing transposase RayT
MPHALAEIYVHIVFSTRDRVPFLSDRGLRTEMHGYLAGACRNQKCPALIVGGVEDHVHILCRFGRTLTVANLLKGLKQESSKWIKTKDESLRDFYWQEGYGAFSTIPDRLSALRRYIAEQEEHHKKESFKNEYRRLLKAYNVEYDERYVWD